MKKQVKSYIWGGLAAAAVLGIGIAVSSSAREYIYFGVLSLMASTLVSCLFLDNNFIGEMILEILSWGFVKMPVLIFSLDLDGIIWLLTVKLLFWILGLLLAIACGILGIGLGLFVSVFVYPFALYKSYKHPEDT